MRLRFRLSLAALLCALAVSSVWAEPIRITVLQTNDIHGWIMPRPSKEEPNRLIGGATALAAAVKSQRGSGPTLLLDAGDWFQGTPEGTLTRGKAVMEVMNALDYDAVEVGNHDFDLGQPALKELATGLRMPVLGANVLDKASGQQVDYLKPYVIKDIAGVRVGIFGLLTTNMRNLSFAKNIAGLEFADEVESAKKAVAELKAQGATVIIAVTHVGWENPKKPPFVGDKTLAARVPGIDLIVGGHSHTFLRQPLRDPVNGTLVTQAGCYLTDMGRVTLDVDPGTKKVVRSSGALESLWVDKLGQDLVVQGIVGRYEQEVGKALDVVVATAAEALHRDRENESSIGDWMTDCARKWAKTQIAFQNSGGIRADLEAGPVTLRNLFTVMPFDNQVMTMSMSGRLIKDVLEHGVSGVSGLIQVSGVRMRYSPEREAGHRVLKVWVGRQALKDDKVYSVSAADFLVQGGDGYTPFSQATDKVSTGVLVRDVLTGCAKENSPIKAPPIDRIIKVPPITHSH